MRHGGGGAERKPKRERSARQKSHGKNKAEGAPRSVRRTAQTITMGAARAASAKKSKVRSAEPSAMAAAESARRWRADRRSRRSGAGAELPPMSRKRRRRGRSGAERSPSRAKRGEARVLKPIIYLIIPTEFRQRHSVRLLLSRPFSFFRSLQRAWIFSNQQQKILDFTTGVKNSIRPRADFCAWLKSACFLTPSIILVAWNLTATRAVLPSIRATNQPRKMRTTVRIMPSAERASGSMISSLAILNVT